MLSEYAVLGFEYGYSLSEPNALTLWEAQFGDFANGAQIMFDQFIYSGESKWLRMSGLVMLLPHGYEGQGPGTLLRPARTLPAAMRGRQLDRRQLHDARELLPHPAPPDAPQLPQAADPDDAEVAPAPPDARSRTRRISPTAPPSTASSGTMRRRAIRPRSSKADDKIKRVVMCSGKVYYDLLAERDAQGIDDIYLLRVEQFYPFPTLSLVKELARFPNADFVWCQEEPKNQGAWSFIEPEIERC